MAKKSSKGSELPFVSICTPTFNRRPFIEIMLQCFRNQDYPKENIEWIIVDDGTDKIKDLIDKANIPQIKYFALEKKLPLGAKRNHMHTLAKGDIIVYIDDDDYYPPERISHAVEKLEANKQALCAGASEIYVYYKHVRKMIQCGPYGPNHATAGTFAFRKELLKLTKYDDTAELAEEKQFLKDYTIPFVQLDPLKTILVFSHDHNTFDKKKLFENAHPEYFRESTKTVDSFIRKSDEDKIKKFFTSDIDLLLKNYEAGLPKMKPGVLKQIKKIEEDHKKIVEEHMKAQQQNGQGGQIMLERPGEPPIVLSSQDVVNIIKQQQQQIEQLTKRVTDMNEIIQKMQEKILFMRNAEKDLQKELNDAKSKTMNDESNVTEPVTVTEVPDATPGPSSAPEEKVEIKLNKSEPEIKVQLKRR
jgi:glycosyltransferase involved in cell wall biosynthesis